MKKNIKLTSTQECAYRSMAEQIISELRCINLDCASFKMIDDAKAKIKSVVSNKELEDFKYNFCCVRQFRERHNVTFADIRHEYQDALISGNSKLKLSSSVTCYYDSTQEEIRSNLQKDIEIKAAYIDLVIFARKALRKIDVIAYNLLMMQ